MPENKKVYFANEPDPEKLAGAIWERRDKYLKYLHNSGLYALYRRMHWMYYGHDTKGFTSHQVHSDGKEGEIARLRLNHLRSIVTSWLNLATAQRPTMDPIAVAGDYESEVQEKRARALIDHYQFKLKFEEAEKEALELAAVLGCGYEFRRWNPNIGEVTLPMDLGELGIAVQQGQMSPDQAQSTENQAKAEVAKRSGDLESFALGPLDVMFDPFRKNSRFPWTIVRLFENRYDLIARYPAFEEQILAIGPERSDYAVDFDLYRSEEERSHDEIPILYLLHEKTEGVPAGKSVCVLDSKTALHVDALGYRESPVRRIATADLRRTPFAYTPAFDLLAPQEACDALTSITLTNQKTFGLGAIMAPKGQGIDPMQISEGLVLVEYTPGLDKPEAMVMPATPQDVYVARKQWVDEMGTILGVNQVIRGNPEASLKSGSALALVQAMGVQFSSGFQANIVTWREAKALDVVVICVDNMKDERQFEIIGDSATASALTAGFTGEGVSKIVKVRFNQVNPLAKTMSGRVEIADTLMERFSSVLTPGDYFRILETGNGDHLIRGQSMRQRLIDRENEMLAKGIGPPPLEPMHDPMGNPVVDPATGQPKMAPAQAQPGQQFLICLITDDHREHVRGHLEVLANPAVRQGDTPLARAVIKAVLDHIDEHENQLAQMTTARPGLLELTNQMPLQAALPPPMLPAGPGGQPQPGAHPALPPGQSPPPKAPAGPQMQPAPPGGGKTPRMPSMPVNPANGQRVEPPPQPAAPH